MNERTTAEIVADLQYVAVIHAGRVRHDCILEAAHRLKDLDDQLRWSEDDSGRTRAKLLAHDALRPPCPTCGGDDPLMQPHLCRDCTDGRVSWERLVNVFNAVHEWNEQPNSQGRTPYEGGRASQIVDLRGIR